MEISKTDIKMIIRLLEQGEVAIEKYSPKISAEQDVARRIKKMIKKLKKQYSYVCAKGKIE